MKDHKHYKTAYHAHYHTSFSPDKRAESACKGLDADIENLKALDVPQEKINKYESLWVKWMNAKSRCMSSMITGPANFPVRRAEKANNAERRAGDECLGYYNKLMNYAKKEKHYAENPDARPIQSGDSDALQRLQAKLGTSKELQEQMKAVNKAHRAFLKNPATLEKSGLSETQKETVRNYKPAYSWEPNPYAPFQLQNNLANIKRIEGRIKDIENRKDSDAKDFTINGVRCVENTEDMRLQLFFEGKPSDEMRKTLKSNAFKWAPSKGAWQRQLTNNAVWAFNQYVLPELKRMEV